MQYEKDDFCYNLENVIQKICHSKSVTYPFVVFSMVNVVKEYSEYEIKLSFAKDTVFELQADSFMRNCMLEISKKFNVYNWHDVSTSIETRYILCFSKKEADLINVLLKMEQANV